MFYVLTFIFGTIIGSFLNVVILRLGTGRGIMGRSSCGSCGKVLRWFELVPILSFFFLQGRCGRCQSKISYQYVLVEIVTGFLFLLSFALFSPLKGGLVALIACICLVITVYDLRHMIIPDRAVFSLIALGLIFQFFYFTQQGFSMFRLLDILAGPIFFLFFAGIWYFSDGRGMGFGDAKLALAIGLLVGFEKGLVSLILSFWIGALIGVILIVLSGHFLIKKKYNLKKEIPFGPFILLGLAITFFFNLDLMWVSSLFTFL